MTKFKVEIPKLDPEVLMHYAYGKIEKPKGQTRSDWLIERVLQQSQGVQQAQKDKKDDDKDSKQEETKQLAKSSVNAALSKPKPSRRISDAARTLHLKWLDDFVEEKGRKIKKEERDKLKKSNVDIIDEFYDKLKAPQESTEVLAESWKGFETTLETAEVIVVFNPELKGAKNFLDDILKLYGKRIKQADGNSAKVPRLFVVCMDQIFLPGFEKRDHESESGKQDHEFDDLTPVDPVNAFFEDVQFLLKDSLDNSQGDHWIRSIFEKVIMVRMPNSLCLRPEVFLDPHENKECSGFAFFNEPGVGWRPIRLEREVCRLWRNYVGKRIKYSDGKPSKSSRQDQSNGQPLKSNICNNYSFHNTEFNNRLPGLAVNRPEPTPQEHLV